MSKYTECRLSQSTGKCHSPICERKIRTDYAGRDQTFSRNRISGQIQYEKRLLSTKSRYTIRSDGRAFGPKRYNSDTGNIVNGGLPNSVENPYIQSSGWGWPIDPTGLRYTLNRFYDRYQIPLFIVENGFGAVDTLEKDGSVYDPKRIEYLKAHIKALKKAVNYDGVDLISYTPWGIIDIVSFTTGEIKNGMA